MERSLFAKLVTAIVNDKHAGFGYIDAFARCLDDSRAELGIGNIALVVQITVGDKVHEEIHFYGTSRFNLNSFNLPLLMSTGRCIDSTREDIRPFKHSSEFLKFHTIIFPFTGERDSYSSYYNVRGSLILLSFDRIRLSFEEEDIIYQILSSQTCKGCEYSFAKACIAHLINDKVRLDQISIKERYRTLSEALDILAECHQEISPETGLKHFTLWSSSSYSGNQIHKEFNKNTCNGRVHDKTHFSVMPRSHYVAFCKDEFSKEQDSLPVMLYPYRDVKQFVLEADYFTEIGINDDNSAVLVFPIYHDEYTSICCFYIKNISFTPFVSGSFLQILSKVIKQRTDLVTELNIKNMLNNVMASALSTDDSIRHYEDVTKILAESSEAENCLVYLKSERDNRFLLVPTEDENVTSSYRDPYISMEDIGITLHFPLVEYFFDQGFMSFFGKALVSHDESLLYIASNKNQVRTACISKIYNEKEDLIGFVLLVNSNRTPTTRGVCYNKVFTVSTINVLQSCCHYLQIYYKLQQSNHKKNYLLKKLRHEIPNSVQVIRRNADEILGNFDDRGYRVSLFPRKMREIIMNNNRINLLSTFFSSSDFPDERFREKPLKFRVQEYVDENIEIFRNEALLRGIQIACNIGLDTRTLFVSEFYQLAINNLIINAIRYASPGSCIWITSDYETLSVSNIGFPVRESEKELIFREAFRGQDARRVDQKGIGYGLYMVKRIMTAYHHDISVRSEYVAKDDLFAGYALSEAIGKMSEAERDEYIFRDTLPQHRDQMITRLFEIQRSKSMIPEKYRNYLNKDEAIIMKWFDYQNRYGSDFIDMKEDLLSKSIYCVTFTISFDHEKDISY